MKTKHEFPGVLAPHHFLLVPFVLGEGFGEQAGTISHVKVKPGNDHPTLFDVKWEKNADGRPHILRKIELKESQIDAGCFLLEDAYIEEGWSEGWSAYRRWMEGTVPRTNTSGRRVAPNRGRPFPSEHLPKKVLALRGHAEAEAKKHDLPAGLVHPADRNGGRSQPAKRDGQRLAELTGRVEEEQERRRMAERERDILQQQLDALETKAAQQPKDGKK